MNSTKFIFIIFTFTQIQLKITNGVSAMDLSSLNPNELNTMSANRACMMGDCGVIEEVGMDSEINRRVLLMQKKYISYETLKRDLVPCGTPGASYYNCKASGQANPYNRGCEVITRCARNKS